MVPNSCAGCVFFFSSRRRHTRYIGDWSSDVCSSDLASQSPSLAGPAPAPPQACSAHPPHAPQESRIRAVRGSRSEERRVGKECRAESTTYEKGNTRTRGPQGDAADTNRISAARSGEE